MIESMDRLFDHIASPLQEVRDKLFQEKGVRLLVKRDDLLGIKTELKTGLEEYGPAFCGNKWRKLKYNLKEAKRLNLSCLLTFGGAYSNHITAVAAAGHLFGFETIGLIRGEEHLPLNPSLKFAKACGMQLHYVSRVEYRKKHAAHFQNQINNRFSPCYIIPEGGTNAFAREGCQEMVREILIQNQNKLPDYFCVSCGTGGTFSGLLTGLAGRAYGLGFSALKGDFMTEEVQQQLAQQTDKILTNWGIQNNYHFGGFAKFKPDLFTFIQDFEQQYQIQLDPIYTGKMFFGLFELIKKDYFPSGSTIVAIHTGGMQAWAGVKERFGEG